MRDYESSPHINLEDHPHIRELIETQGKRAADRTDHQNRIKTAEERDKDIAAVPHKQVMFFFCSRCKKDFIGEAFKHIEEDWTKSGQHFASYKTKCFCGKWCTRFITDRHKEPYPFRSKRIARERQAFHADLLQPFETNYQLMYSDKRA